ncbi:MAG TPA: DUF4402 domain-containing protein [Gemmatimonadales bacterium]|nr:DUF4402 domain-containing protein [Gemmatimonadales bacterium]
MSLLAAEARAQNSASITATANVLTPLTVVGAQNLSFGNVFPGLNKTVAVTDAGAGRFDVAGQANANVSLSFVLPSNLSDGSGNLLPIGSWTGEHNTTGTATGANFTPSAGATNTTLSGTGNLYVFIGGQVTPAVNQPAGLYSGSVQMTVVYF